MYYIRQSSPFSSFLSNSVRTTLHERNETKSSLLCVGTLSSHSQQELQRYNRMARQKHPHVRGNVVYSFHGPRIVTLRTRSRGLQHRRPCRAGDFWTCCFIDKSVRPLFIIPQLLISTNHRATVVKLGRGIRRRLSCRDDDKLFRYRMTAL